MLDGRELRAERVIGMRVLLGLLRSRFRGVGGGCRIRVFCNILRFSPEIRRKMQTHDDEMWNPVRNLEGGGAPASL